MKTPGRWGFGYGAGGDGITAGMKSVEREYALGRMGKRTATFQ